MRLPFVLLFCLMASLAAAPAAPMEAVRVAADGKGFVLQPSGKPFTPWGMNYLSNDLEERWDKDRPAIERDLAELKRLGADVLRIHLQFNQFMAGPDEPRRHALRRLGWFLKRAEKYGLYLDITGLACYSPAQRQRWYDALAEEQRWAAQARFWQAVARQCAASPAVFCYDLMNEPVAPAGDGRKSGQWYSGQLLGGYDYLQWIALNQKGRPRDGIARDWARTLVMAIRREDRKHLVTVGLLPTVNGSYFFGFVPATLAPEVDFISVHIYPEHKKPSEAIKILQQFAVPGKPLVIEETFPLNCSTDELRSFLLDSRSIATGWMGHYLGKTQKELENLERGGPLSLSDKISLQWFQLFQNIKRQMISAN
jgi:hypothetical protein